MADWPLLMTSRENNQLQHNIVGVWLFSCTLFLNCIITPQKKKEKKETEKNKATIQCQPVTIKSIGYDDIED